jgi:hypothetical protein
MLDSQFRVSAELVLVPVEQYMFSVITGLGHVAHLSVRIIEGCMGLLFFYFAVFLYEDQDGRIQNKLEGWWIRISDQQNVAISRNVVFVRVVASLATKVFDRLFGNKILSARAVFASVCFSLASWFLAELSWLLAFRTEDFWITFELHHPMVLPVCILGFAVFLCLGLLPLLVKRLGAAPVLVVAFILSTLGPLFFSLSFQWQEVLDVPTVGTFSGLFPGLVASFLCDIFFVALTRLMLRKVVSKSSFMVMFGMILLNCFMALLLVVMPYFLGLLYLVWHPHRFMPFRFLSLLAAFNLFDGLVSMIFVLLAFITILHILFWPVINRSLYAVAGLGIARRRKLMGVLGVSLLAVSTGKSLELLKNMLEIFGGK